jgi:hypothetical protein
MSGNRGIAWNFTFILELSTALIGKNSTHERCNTDSELIDIASCKASENI